MNPPAKPASPRVYYVPENILYPALAYTAGHKVGEVHLVRLSEFKALENENAELYGALQGQKVLLQTVQHQRDTYFKQLEALEARLAQAEEVLKFYQGDFDGKDGTKWNEDTFFLEDKFGKTWTAEGPERARAYFANAKKESE